MKMRAFLLILLAACAGIELRAQSTKAELFGVVRDPSSLAVENAEVRLVDRRTGAKQLASTDTEGRYHFFALRPGTYSIAVAKPGFAVLQRDGLVLRVGDRIAVDLDLRIGSVGESVTVTAEAP